MANRTLITWKIVRDHILSQIAAILEARELHHRATVLISVLDDSSRTWSSVRRVSGSVRAVCAATIRRVSRRDGYTTAMSFNDVARNRSATIRAASGKLRRTTLLSSKSVWNTLRRRTDLCYTPTAITSATRSAIPTTCVNLQVCGVSVFLRVGVVGIPI